MGSLMLEGTCGVPVSNLLLKAGLILHFDWLLRALSDVVLKTYKDKRFYNLFASGRLFPLYLIILVTPLPPISGWKLSCFRLWPLFLLAVQCCEAAHFVVLMMPP